MRRGCVWPIRPARRRARRARQIFGSCVVLPEPVSPQTMTTWCSRIARSDLVGARGRPAARADRRCAGVAAARRAPWRPSAAIGLRQAARAGRPASRAILRPAGAMARHAGASHRKIGRADRRQVGAARRSNAIVKFYRPCVRCRRAAFIMAPLSRPEDPMLPRLHPVSHAAVLTAIASRRARAAKTLRWAGPRRHCRRPIRIRRTRT